MHGWSLSRGAEPSEERAWGPAVLGLFMNEPGKKADSEVTSFASITCLG